MKTMMIVSLATGLAALTAMHAPAAEAKGKGVKHKYHKHHVLKWHQWHVMPYHVVRHDGCSYYYWKWQNTGSKYWKTKYFTCIY